MNQQVLTGAFIIINLWISPVLGQQVQDVPVAFDRLNAEPMVMLIKNKLKVPTEGGHLQGVQVMESNDISKLLISGSSSHTAYMLQADLSTQKTENLKPLMEDPFRHAGGFQVSGNYLAVGIEDNHLRTTSKVCLYNFPGTKLKIAQPHFVIDREGEAEQKTAGATGLLALDNDFLILVGNWGSRTWDFYSFDPDKAEQRLLASFTAPDDWGAYQSINLIRDHEAIYAMGTYKNDLTNFADLILVSKTETFEPIMQKISTKSFNCKNGADFSTAAGIQVDRDGNLHLWATQRDALKQIAVNRFSE